MTPRSLQSSLHQLCKHAYTSSATVQGAVPPPGLGAACRLASTAAHCTEESSERGASSASVHEHASAANGHQEQGSEASSSYASTPATAAARAAQPASTSSAFWWLQGGGSSSLQHSSPSLTCHKTSASLLAPASLPLSALASSPSLSLAQQPALPLCWLQHRGYKSNKKSMKPVHVKSNRLAVEPLLPPISPEEQERRTRYQRAPIIDTALPPIPPVPRPDAMSRVGYITRGYQLEMQPKFAVVELAGTQFKVTVDDVIFINSLFGQARINEVLSLGRVMLLGSTETTLIGRPYVPGAYVEAAVEEHFLDGKVHVFKFKRRNRYRKYAAPRPQLTTLRILSIHGLPGDSATAHTPSAASAPESTAGSVTGGADESSGAAGAIAAQPGTAQQPARHPVLPISYYAQAQSLQ